MTMHHPRYRERDASVELTVAQWVEILDSIEWDKPMLAALIEAQVDASLGLKLRPPNEDGPSASGPKGGA